MNWIDENLIWFVQCSHDTNVLIEINVAFIIRINFSYCSLFRMVFSCPWESALAVLGFLWACYSVCNPLYASNLRWYFELVWFPFVWIARPGLPAVCPSALSLSFVHLRLIWLAASAPFRKRSSPVCLLLSPSPSYPSSISSGTLLSPERSCLE